MLRQFFKVFLPPIFEDEEKTRAARYLNAILIASFGLLLILIFSGQYIFAVTFIFSLLEAFFIGLFFLVRKGQVKNTGTLYISIIWLSMTYLAWTGEGVLDVGLMVYVILIFLSSLLGNAQISITLTLLSVLSTWGLFYAETQGFLIPTSETLMANTFSTSGIFIIAQVIIYFTVRDLEKTLATTRENERKLIEHNKKLLALQENLEKHASELETVSEKSQRQALRLQTMTEVSEAISLTQNLETLLPKITESISEGFNFYHIGIFSVEEEGNIIRLEAANSAEGKKMLESEYQINAKKDQENCIARVARDGQPFVAIDLDEDHTYFNPNLPNTHSKIALPLKISGKTIGVLDIQSTLPSVFSQDETDAFVSLANQVAIAIENASQADITQAALKEAKAVSRQYIHQAWTELGATQRQQGYRYVEKNVTALSEKTEENPVESTHAISIPVQVHDEIIGYIEVSKEDSTKNITTEEKELVEAIANRAALALENARLLEETTRRAGRESLVSNITTKIRSTNDPKVMIETALDELKTALGATKVELTQKKLEADEKENVKKNQKPI